MTVRYPRNTGSPMETYGVVASYDPTDDSYDVLANFQGPFSIHAVVARALKVPGNRLRLRTPPDSGGSFGVKQGVAPYAVLIAATARLGPAGEVDRGPAGAPLGLRLRYQPGHDAPRRLRGGRARHRPRLDQIEDCGAYLRAPEPATLYRMHGNLTAHTPSAMSPCATGWC